MVVGRCPAELNGQQCILQADHDGQHRLNWDPPTSQAPPNRTASKPLVTQGRLLAIVGAVIIGAGLYSVLRSTTPSGPSTSSSDASIQAAIAEGINNFPDTTASVPRDSSGKPDMTVKDRVVIVSTLDPASATQLCQFVAGLHDPNTAAALGVVGVIVIAGGQQVATCHP
jgi:hypothetical protein